MVHQALSERLPIRSVNRYADGVENTSNKKFSFAVRENDDLKIIFPNHNNLKNDGGIAKSTNITGNVPKLGALLPVETNISVTEYFDHPRENELAFLSVDWSEDWLHILNENQINSVT